MKRRSPISQLAVFGLALSLACRPPLPDNVVRVGTDVDAETLDPRLTRNTTGYRVVNLMYDGLIRLDTALQPVPGLAESWEQTSPVNWVFHLREGARFHDGSAVTAHDVVYTFETLLDPALGAPTRRLYTPIQRIEAVGEHQVRVTLHEPYAPFLRYLDMGIVPKSLVENGHDLNARPIGSGPYRMVRWDKGSRITLEANADYWAGAPGVQAIEVVLVPDNTARAQAFEAGDLDIIQSPMGPQDIERLTRNDEFGHRIRPGIAITYLNFNTQAPLLADPRLRRALAMLVDQRTIVDQIYENIDAVAQSVLLPGSWAFDPSIRQPGYDPDEAVRSLDELGWVDTNGDGVRDRDGQRLAVSLGTHSEDVNRIQTLEFLQYAFGQHGIAAEIWISDWPSFSARRDAGDYEIILLGWTQIVDPYRVMFEQLHSKGGLNWGRYRNPRLDSLLEVGRRRQAIAERADAYRAAARIVATDVPYFVLSYQGHQLFHQRRVIGLETSPRGMLRGLAGATLN